MSGPTQPLYDPNRGFRMFLYDEIYKGPSESGQWVPNVSDAVWDWTQGMMRVTHVDTTTFVSTLTPFTVLSPINTSADDDILLGSGPGTVSDSFRIFINDQQYPMPLAMDARLHIPSSEAEYIKIFKGVDISQQGVVISAMFDAGGNMTSENIPLVQIRNDNTEYVAVKVPVQAYSTVQLENNEVVSAVVYNNSGIPIQVSRLRVMNTGYVRQVNASKKYITGIELLSPYMSNVQSKTLEMPMNLPLHSSMLMARVSYSNGQEYVAPIDGNKFSVHGLETYVSTHLGQRVGLVLVYRLSASELVTEQSYNVNQVGGTYFIEEDYELVTIESNDAYNVRIHSYPKWNADDSLYELEHFLYNLDRDENLNVTSLVTMNVGSPAFQPTLFTGEWQNMGIKINLHDVNPSTYNHFIHVQPLHVSLHQNGNATATGPWRVRHDQGDTAYGADVFASFTSVSLTTVQEWSVNIASGLTDLQTWLDTVYALTKPLYNPSAESAPLVPTHMRLFINKGAGFTKTVPIGEALNQITFDSVPLNIVHNGGLLYIEFIRQPVSGPDIILSLAALHISVE